MHNTNTDDCCSRCGAGLAYWGGRKKFVAKSKHFLCESWVDPDGREYESAPCLRRQLARTKNALKEVPLSKCFEVIEDYGVTSILEDIYCLVVDGELVNFEYEIMTLPQFRKLIRRIQNACDEDSFSFLNK